MSKLVPQAGGDPALDAVAVQGRHVRGDVRDLLHVPAQGDARMQASVL